MSRIWISYNDLALRRKYNDGNWIGVTIQKLSQVNSIMDPEHGERIR